MIPSVVIGGMAKSVNWANQTHGSAVNEVIKIFVLGLANNFF